ncbi:hypothetical protein GV794_02170 [Nocardia cyriacigeorgica]|uniref:Carboxypeptidase regulatory-like domain-containing protein n=1 Tax=Nocardia cyriacigeorgica TaxID=135487 RepID=A0ABX0CD30_9NOCA|nr:hypothetical protein [Nocardia cyriacigeorgica]NEW42767.1 hypothetical protein [Nocardia cyriacigeorgica]NEW53938.1 hypothetical protein [Nocardia cyriacigeorgica]NEW54473.1 hypothetical protein [Nocardia cyriacigeorgica]
MFKYKRTGLALAAGVAVLGLTACDPSTIDGRATPTATVHEVEQPETRPQWPTTVDAIVEPDDPYSTDGAWFIGSEIAPGDYRVIVTSEFGGGWKLCATIQCEIGTPGFIDNDFVTNRGYVTIPADALLIELTNVRLEAVA